VLPNLNRNAVCVDAASRFPDCAGAVDFAQQFSLFGDDSASGLPLIGRKMGSGSKSITTPHRLENIGARSHL